MYGMPLHFLYCSEIWHLHEISMVNDTLHTIKFIQEFEIYILYGSEIWNLHDISLVNISH